AARPRRVRFPRGAKRAVEIPDADRVDLAVVTFDAINRILRELDRGDLLCGQRGRQLDRALVTPFRFRHDMLLRFPDGMMRSLTECRNRRLIAIDMWLAVIAGRSSNKSAVIAR